MLVWGRFSPPTINIGQKVGEDLIIVPRVQATCVLCLSNMLMLGLDKLYFSLRATSIEEAIETTNSFGSQGFIRLGVLQLLFANHGSVDYSIL